MTGLGESITRYGAVAVGLMLGTAAKYGVAINDGETPTWAAVAADILMLGMLGLIAVVAGDVMALTNQNARMFVAAISALLSARLIKLVRDKGLKRAERELGAIDGTPAAAPANKDAAPSESAAARPGVGEALRQSYRATAAAPLPHDMQQQLRDIDQKDRQP